MSREPLADGEEFIAEVCWHYYVNELTQAETARIMDVTRLRVNQAIQRAKALGIVKISIESPFLPRFELQKRLMRELGIKQAIVCPANHSDYEFHRSVGAALAEHLTERLRVAEWKSFGVSWGLTLDSAIRRLQRQSHPNVEVVSILGGTAQGDALIGFGCLLPPVCILRERRGRSHCKRQHRCAELKSKVHVGLLPKVLWEQPAHRTRHALDSPSPT